MENPHFSAQRSHKIPKQVSIFFFLPAWLLCPYLDLGSLEQVRDLPAPTREGYEGLLPHCLSSAPSHLRSCDSQFLASRPVSFLKKNCTLWAFQKRVNHLSMLLWREKISPLVLKWTFNPTISQPRPWQIPSLLLVPPTLSLSVQIGFHWILSSSRWCLDLGCVKL